MLIIIEIQARTYSSSCTETKIIFLVHNCVLNLINGFTFPLQTLKLLIWYITEDLEVFKDQVKSEKCPLSQFVIDVVLQRR